jgi:hypothetical protein
VEDVTDGFWEWRRHGDIVLMSAELELSAWAINGRKLWSKHVEPPWSYEIRDDRVELDVMGERSNFVVAIGPPSRGLT